MAYTVTSKLIAAISILLVCVLSVLCAIETDPCDSFIRTICAPAPSTILTDFLYSILP